MWSRSSHSESESVLLAGLSLVTRLPLRATSGAYIGGLLAVAVPYDSIWHPSLNDNGGGANIGLGILLLLLISPADLRTGRTLTTPQTTHAFWSVVDLTPPGSHALEGMAFPRRHFDSPLRTVAGDSRSGLAYTFISQPKRHCSLVCHFSSTISGMIKSVLFGIQLKQ